MTQSYQNTVTLGGIEIDISNYPINLKKGMIARERMEREEALRKHREMSPDLRSTWKRLMSGAHTYHGASDAYQAKMRPVRGEKSKPEVLRMYQSI